MVRNLETLGRVVALLPVVIFPVLLISLHLSVPQNGFFDPPWLVLIANAVFIGCTSYLLAAMAWRNYRRSGRVLMLLMGCAMLFLGTGAVVAGTVRGLPGGANLNVTIYNTGALLAALLHSLAALVLASGRTMQTPGRRRTVWLILGYGGSLLLMGLLTLASFKGFIPPFFVQNSGPTLLRQHLLGAAIMMFLCSSLVFMVTFFRIRECFLFWYGVALALTAIGLTGFFIQHSVGSVVGWVGRGSQYLGGAYFLAALLCAGRSAKRRGTSLDDALLASLAGTEERLKIAFANAAIGFAIARTDGRFVDANPAYCALTGYDQSELRALNFSELVHPDDRAANLEITRSMLAGEIPDFTVENRYLRKGGTPIWVRKSISPVRDSSGVPLAVLAFIENITDCKEAEQQTARDLEAMTRLQKLGTLYVQGGNLGPVLDEVVAAAIDITGADFGDIQLLDHKTGDLHVVAQQGFPQWWLDFWASAAMGTGCCGTALERCERVMVADVAESPIFAGTQALEVQLRAGVRAVQSTPLLSRSGEPLGVFSTHYRTRCTPDHHALRLLDLLARQAADIIARTQGEEELRVQSEQLRQSRQEALDLAREATSARLRAEKTASVLGSINELLERTLASETEMDLCEAALHIVEKTTGSRISFIGEIGPDGLLRDLAISNPGWQACAICNQAGNRNPPRNFSIHGIYGRVLQGGISLIANDPASHPDWGGVPDGHPPVDSFLGTPLWREGKIIGLIAVGNRAGGYGSEERETLEAIAPIVVEALFRKRNADELFAAHQRLETLMDALPVGVSFSHDETCGYITGNPTVLRQFEVSSVENLSASAPEMTAPGRLVRFFKAGREITGVELPLQRAVAENRIIPPMEFEVVLPSGKSWFASTSAAPLHDHNGKVTGGVAVTMDITERKEVEQRLAADLAVLTRLHSLSERMVEDAGIGPLLQEVMDAAVDIVQADKGTLQLLEEDGLRFVAHNGHDPSFLEYFAVLNHGPSACGEVVNQGQRVVVPDVESSPIFAGTAALAVLRAAGVRAVQCTPLLTRSGWLLGVLSTHFSTPHVPSEHDLWRIDLLVRQASDLIEQKRAQDALMQLNQELERRVLDRTVKLTAINKELQSFCYSVTHELGAPLRSMNCFSSILLEEHGDTLDPEGKNYLERIAASAVRMGGLVEDLLLLSRVTRMQLTRETVDLSALARVIIDELQEQEPGREVEAEIAPGVDGLWDPALVKLVLQNLLGNAWKYTRNQPGARIEFGRLPRAKEKVFFVRDNGIGFDMAYAGKIFLPFERLHRVTEFEGTGIGLATVQRAVEMHGGRVWAEAEVGRGATFYFSEPLTGHHA